MPTLNIPDEQVIELIGQLADSARREALRRLLADPRWDELLAHGESRLDAELARRGLDRSTMTPDELEAVVRQIADGC